MVAVVTFSRVSWSGLTAQNWRQQHQGPTQTAIIFTLEPVFAVIFASFIIGDEVMTWLGWLGCILIFIAILITVLKNNTNNKHVGNDTNFKFEEAHD